MGKLLLLAASGRVVSEYFPPTTTTTSSSTARVSGKKHRQYQPHLHGQAVELVFNLDEGGCSDWEDHCEKSAIVPTVFKGRMIHHKVKN
jgi:hypothetical protein